MNDSYVKGPPPDFIVYPQISSVVDQLIVVSIGRYLKPSTDCGGTNGNLELLPDPNAESDESARAIVVAAANKEVVAVLSGTTTIYYNNRKIIY